MNLGASVIYAIVAGSIVAALGEGSIYAFEQVYLGNKNVADIDWLKRVMESKFSSQFIESSITASDKITNSTDNKGIANIILEMFKKESM